MPNNHPPDIYDQHSTERFVIPFNLEISPMERLLLINIEHDPDEVYVGFEPQVFDDPTTGTGFMVIAWRKDGKVDIYHQPGLILERENYDIVGKGLDNLVEQPFDNARFEITDQGVDLNFSFEDKQGRRVSTRIHESGNKPRKPFALLAPFPSDTENPPSLPLVLLYDFYFVRKSGTDLEIKTAGRNHRPDSLPVPMDGSWMYFIRYALDPYILNWNSAYDGLLDLLQPPGTGEFSYQGAVYELVQNANHFEISSMRPENGSRDVQFTFEPPFPHLTRLGDGVEVHGAFTIWMGETMGSIDGHYQVYRHGNQVEIEVHPSGGWHPRVHKWSVWFMFRVVPVFKNWSKTYRWTAKVDLSQPDAPKMRSSWNRI
jgi:hypothetical protein